MSDLSFTVNGKEVSTPVASDTPLIYLLRNDLGLKGTRLGCGMGHCGACTVMINGRAQQSCTTPLWSVAGAHITTIEGLAPGEGALDPLQQAFLDEQAAQCAYCISGIIMTAKALLMRHPDASDQLIRAELSERHLCRCGAHQRILAAIRKAADSAVALAPHAGEGW